MNCIKLRCSKILISGGTSGIGLGIAKRFLEDNVKVVICGRSEERLDNIKSELQSPNLYTMKWDVSDFDNMEKNTNHAAALMDGLDGFVNNAATL